MHLEDVIPVMAVKDACIISRRGEITLGWEVSLPAVYTLGEEEYDDMIGSFASAIRLLPLWTVVHRQDVYTYRTWGEDESDMLEDTFFAQCYRRHFEGRRYLVHRQFLYLTLSSKGNVMRPHMASAAFGIKINAKGPSVKVVKEFISKAEEFVSSVTATGRIAMRRLSQEELLGRQGSGGLLDDYLNLFDKGPLCSDIPMSGGHVQVRDKHMLGFTIADAEVMPGQISSVAKVEKLSGPVSQVYVSSGAALGPMLDCEHIVNHVIVLPQQSYVMNELEKKRKRNTSMASSGAENRVNAEEIGIYIDDVHRDSLTSVYAHMNVLAWGDEDELDTIRGKVSSALTMAGITAVQNMHDLPVVWLAGMPGAICELTKENYMIMELESSLCMGINETYEKPVAGGLFPICDRMRNIPINIDVQKVARSNRLIDNYNAFVLGPSGSGKSFFMNYYLRNCYDAGQEVFVIDVGDSYEGLCEVIREESDGKDGMYHSWDVDHPFSFAPFTDYPEWLSPSGTSLRMDSNGATFFMSFLQTLWAPSGGWTSSTTPILRQTVVDFLNMAVKSFLPRGIEPVFDDYYKFLKSMISPAIEKGKYNVRDEEVGLDSFDIKDFRLALSPYAHEGEFSFLLNDRSGKDLFKSRFTVFEVDKLSQVEDKKFYSLCVLCIMNSFDHKMRTSSNFKIMVIEEAWKAIANETMAPYLKGLWKTARKFSTSAMVVTQEIGDITSSSIIKDAILNNSAVKYLLDQSSNQNRMGELVEMLGLSPRERNLVLSINRANNSAYNYREVFVKWNSRCGVYATEASAEEALAYESDKNIKRPVYELAEKTGSLREAIRITAMKK